MQCLNLKLILKGNRSTFTDKSGDQKYLRRKEPMDLNESILQAKDLDQQGVALFRAGNVEAALEKYQQAMDIEPMLADSYRNMGDLYLATEKYQDAKELLQKGTAN